MDRATSKQIADALGITKRSADRRASREVWPCEETKVRGGTQREFAVARLPHDVQVALVMTFEPRIAPTARPKAAREKRSYGQDQIEAAWDRYARLPQRTKDIGLARTRALQAAIQMEHAGLSRCDADRQVAAQADVSVATLYRWRELVGSADRAYWAALLLPQWAGRTARAEIEPRAWDLYLADYLRPEAPQATACYARLQRIAAKHPEWAPLPSERTFQRKLEREVPRAVQVLNRKGQEALNKMFPAQERDKAVFAALEGVNADGHRFDVFTRWPDGDIGRPVMAAWQDLLSGMLLSHRIGRSETSDLVRLSYADMVMRFGIPEHAWLDNGRSFAAKMLTGGTATRFRFKLREEDPLGVFVALGTEVHWVTPYHGQAKPIERAWRDLCERIAKHPALAGAYTGNNPLAKPENYGSRAVPIDVFLRVVNDEIEQHNVRLGRESAVCSGRSFAQVFEESFRKRVDVRKASDEQQRLLWLSAETVTCSTADGSVRLAGNRYWSEALSVHAGQKVVLRFDPDALHGHVYAYNLGGAFVAKADCIARVGFADKQSAQLHAAARSGVARATKQLSKETKRLGVADVARELLGQAALEELPEVAVRVVTPMQPAIEDGAMSERESSLQEMLKRRMEHMKERAF